MLWIGRRYQKKKCRPCDVAPLSSFSMDSFNGPPVSFLNAWHCRAVNARRHAGDRGFDKGKRFTKNCKHIDELQGKKSGLKIWNADPLNGDSMYHCMMHISWSRNVVTYRQPSGLFLVMDGGEIA
jgi:hypothetical protein